MYAKGACVSLVTHRVIQGCLYSKDDAIRIGQIKLSRDFQEKCDPDSRLKPSLLAESLKPSLPVSSPTISFKHPFADCGLSYNIH
jgi:hypothetical protein